MEWVRKGILLWSQVYGRRGLRVIYTEFLPIRLLGGVLLQTVNLGIRLPRDGVEAAMYVGICHSRKCPNAAAGASRAWLVPVLAC
jgi:hypothetical protein